MGVEVFFMAGVEGHFATACDRFAVRGGLSLRLRCVVCESGHDVG